MLSYFDLWLKMGECMDQLHLVVVAVWHLQRVLSKKRHTFTHILLFDEIIQIATGPEATQITGPPTPAQLKNFMLCQHLQGIHTRISSLVSGLTPQSSVRSAVSHTGVIYGVACDSVESLFQAMLDHPQACILQIHDQNFGVIGLESAVDNNATPYMAELQKFILHFRSEFLSRLLPSSKTAAATGT